MAIVLLWKQRYSRLWLFFAIGLSIASSNDALGLKRPFTRSIYLRGAIVDVGAGVRSKIGFRKDVLHTCKVVVLLFYCEPPKTFQNDF